MPRHIIDEELEGVAAEIEVAFLLTPALR